MLDARCWIRSFGATADCHSLARDLLLKFEHERSHKRDPWDGNTSGGEGIEFADEGDLQVDLVDDGRPDAQTRI